MLARDLSIQVPELLPGRSQQSSLLFACPHLLQAVLLVPQLVTAQTARW